MNQANVDNQAIITLDGVTIRVRDKFILANTNWVIKRHQHWAIIGPNGAGKSSLVRAIVGELPVVRGKIAYHGAELLKDRICYVSFERHQRLIAREKNRDASRYFSGKLNDITTAREVICEALPNLDIPGQQLDAIIAQLGLDDVMDRGIRFLSTGEMRKILIAQALVKSPQLLILDEPFDGLDVASRSKLADMINHLMAQDRQIILVTHRLADILAPISHIMGLKNGEVFFQGKREDTLSADQIQRLYPDNLFDEDEFPIQKYPDDGNTWKPPNVLVEMKNATVKYQNAVILDHLSWKMKSGENWAIIGPNGAGKTTLLNLIVGENLQAYANDIFLFGRRKGTGESVGEIKQRIGLISSEFQIRYRKSIKALDVVISGFFDSVGLYRQSNSAQRELARKWMDFIHLTDKADTLFNQLSYGEQRLVLLARAMVKLPLLLILDEPCQGLDRTNRKMILDLIDFIARHSQTHILFVTHHADEIPDCITHFLQFSKALTGGYAISCARR
ncbi:MAG: ATP-binding cassette domain-containing protein [Desulfobacterales bacterium]|nr:MAG: ATP-binding cassette domain-containing protein [Desulfobacterales bacterium]